MSFFLLTTCSIKFYFHLSKQKNGVLKFIKKLSKNMSHAYDVICDHFFKGVQNSKSLNGCCCSMIFKRYQIVRKLSIRFKRNPGFTLTSERVLKIFYAQNVYLPRDKWRFERQFPFWAKMKTVITATCDDFSENFRTRDKAPGF